MLAALCCFLLAGVVAASSAPSIAGRPAGPLLKVELGGVVQRGSESVSLDAAGKVNPGEVLAWRMAVSNLGDAPSPSVWSVDGDVDAATVYVPGSARADGSPAVTFSIDGGRTFSALPMETYTDGGVEKRRPAPVEAYRVVRFTWASPISPGEVRAAHYKARVR